MARRGSTRDEVTLAGPVHKPRKCSKYVHVSSYNGRVKLVPIDYWYRLDPVPMVRRKWSKRTTLWHFRGLSLAEELSRDNRAKRRASVRSAINDDFYRGEPNTSKRDRSWKTQGKRRKSWCKPVRKVQWHS